MLFSILLLFVLNINFLNIDGFPSGAPLETCISMIPGHKNAEIIQNNSTFLIEIQKVPSTKNEYHSKIESNNYNHQK
jgi:hypothetical protein